MIVVTVQRQLAAILSFWRDAAASGGLVTVPERPPIIMIGDMNLVGDAAELRALRAERRVGNGGRLRGM